MTSVLPQLGNEDTNTVQGGRHVKETRSRGHAYKARKAQDCLSKLQKAGHSRGTQPSQCLQGKEDKTDSTL